MNLTRHTRYHNKGIISNLIVYNICMQIKRGLREPGTWYYFAMAHDIILLSDLNVNMLQAEIELRNTHNELWI